MTCTARALTHRSSTHQLLTPNETSPARRFGLQSMTCSSEGAIDDESDATWYHNLTTNHQKGQVTTPSIAAPASVGHQRCCHDLPRLAYPALLFLFLLPPRMHAIAVLHTYKPTVFYGTASAVLADEGHAHAGNEENLMSSRPRRAPCTRHPSSRTLSRFHRRSRTSSPRRSRPRT